MNKSHCKQFARVARSAVLGGALAAAQCAWAQFATVPAPACDAPKPSVNEIEQEFRIDAARHVYACFPMRVYRGKLPPLLYGVMMVEIELDATGAVVGTSVIRKPAADEVAPWVHAVIRRASPFPAPTKVARTDAGTVRFTEVFFVDKSGQFQLMSITEGQR
jgi:hypothetical protein